MRRLIVLGATVVVAVTAIAGTPRLGSRLDAATLGAEEQRGSKRKAVRRTEVPDKFEGLYNELSQLLDRFDSHLDTKSARRNGSVIFGGELYTANSHRAEGLLDDASALPGSILYLEGLKKMGAGGVSVAMAYPILNDDYPRSKEYWAFYSKLAQEVRRRGMKLHIKSGPMFTEREFTTATIDYSKVTTESYLRDRQRIDERIAAEIRPDYLSIANEPAGEEQVLKVKLTSERYTKYVRDTLRSINARGVLIGAGSGNWDSPEYIKQFVRTDVDFIDLHIYPLASSRDDYMRRALELADIAREAGKKIIIGETWLYKASPKELNSNPTAASVFARDAYSFWAPLDSRFLELLAKMAKTHQIEYVSPFWTKYLFSYVEFGSQGWFAGPKQLTHLSDTATVKELVAGRISETGKAFSRIAGQAR